jgi:hypothetical protein
MALRSSLWLQKNCGKSSSQEHPQIASCIAEAEKAGEQLSDLPKFWK